MKNNLVSLADSKIGRFRDCSQIKNLANSGLNEKPDSEISFACGRFGGISSGELRDVDFRQNVLEGICPKRSAV